MRLLAKSLFGAEEILAKELSELGVKNIEILRRAVAFDGNKEDLYRANLQLRTAVRIIAPFHRFTAKNENELYKKVMEFNWSSILGVDQTFAIDAAVFSNHFKHSQYVAFKIKDGIVDQFRNKLGRRPSVDIKSPDIRLNVHVEKDRFTLSTDSSGDSLHIRGYRPEGHLAPLNEVLANSLLQIAGWNPSIPLVDPMCGSGTFLIEAALMANNVAPARMREKFGFMGWKNYDAETWKKVLQESEKQIQPSKALLIGSDIASGAINISKQSARNAGVISDIKFQKAAFSETSGNEKAGMVIINPPYGERLQVHRIEEMYAMIGDTLKQNYTGYEAWILSSNIEALKHIGLHASRKIDIYNGPLKCKFVQYKLYKGSKKNKS